MNFEQLLARLRAGETLTADELRFVETGLVTRAEAMPGQITAETSPEDTTRIEAEHRAALDEVARVRGLIAASASTITVTLDSSDLQRAMAEERGRIGLLRQIGRDHRMPDEFVERHIDAGTDDVAYRAAVLTELATRSRQSPSNSSVHVIRDEQETRRQGMSQAIACRMARAAGESVTVPPVAQEWAERSIIDIAADCIGYRSAGRFLSARDTDEILRRAMLTTSDFPEILTNAFNVRLLARYKTAEPTYRRWAAPYSAPDFRIVPVVRAGDFPSLQLVNEAGEIKFGSFSESKEQFQVKSYGVRMNISRQLMINDQLGAIEQMLGSAGVRVADWENALMYALLTSASGLGPDLLTDSTAVFDATAHHNYTSSGTAISATSIGVGMALMQNQTTIDGIKANFTPQVLIASPAKAIIAQQIFAPYYPASAAETITNPMRQIEALGDANLTGNGWYLFADPNFAPCFLYGLLQGFEGPRMQSEQMFDSQGMRVKLEHDFGTAAIDYRGAYRNAGA